MASIFTRIIDGDLPGTFVWRDDRCVGFLSINPLRPGHTLVVPRQEIDHWLDAPPDVRDHLFGVAQEIGRAIQSSWQPERVGLMIAGLEVAHLHLHVVPIWTVHDLDFANAAQVVSREELDEAAGLIRSALGERGASGVTTE
jgi:diadenosine tetraphosphate (Ap4A) HIT family hydrolase